MRGIGKIRPPPGLAADGRTDAGSLPEEMTTI
jgi:hypothetical protein